MFQFDAISVIDVFKAIQDYYQKHRHADSNIRESFNGISDGFHKFMDAEEEYKRKAAGHQLYELTPRTHYGFEKDAMLRFYELLSSIKLQNDNITIYNRLVRKGEDILCPYCNLDNASELDHFLPKSKFYEFAVTPANLIPICITCNSLQHKGERFPHKEHDCIVDYILHPYFDDFMHQDWLYAELTHISTHSPQTPESKINLSFKLKTTRPSGMEEATYQMYCYHFEILKLKQRITPRLNEYLLNKKQTFKSYISKGIVCLQEVINKRFEENKNNPIIDIERLFYTALHFDTNSINDLANWCK